MASWGKLKQDDVGSRVREMTDEYDPVFAPIHQLEGNTSKGINDPNDPSTDDIEHAKLRLKNMRALNYLTIFNYSTAASPDWRLFWDRTLDIDRETNPNITADVETERAPEPRDEDTDGANVREANCAGYIRGLITSFLDQKTNEEGEEFSMWLAKALIAAEWEDAPQLLGVDLEEEGAEGGAMSGAEGVDGIADEEGAESEGVGGGSGHNPGRDFLLG